MMCVHFQVTCAMILIACRLFLIFLFFIKCLPAERRIKQGQILETHKPYVVYLVKAPPSPQKYDTWLCGGAIVSTWYILTSAACVEDVQNTYVIAGYRKYVNTDELSKDKCTKDMKKKIVFTCVPKLYELDYARLERWSLIDIALVRVDSAYDFDDDKYTTHCSYKPSIIPINYDTKYQEPGIDAIVLGWGHRTKWRKPGDSSNYNQDIINYAPVLIQNKRDCKKAYSHYKGMSMIIEKYMICTLTSGNIDANGEQIFKSQPLAQGCVTKEEKLMGRQGVMCDETKQHAENEYEEINDYTLIDRTRRQIGLSQSEKASGICQNDHGGPLVTWVGSHETLIGVASVFRVDDKSHCVGPFLFTSTQCNGAFIGCILEHNKTRRMDICDKPAKERGYITVERTISWADHPDGPADNEMPPLRPQIPLWKYE